MMTFDADLLAEIERVAHQQQSTFGEVTTVAKRIIAAINDYTEHSPVLFIQASADAERLLAAALFDYVVDKYNLPQEQAVIDNFNAFFRTVYLLGRIDATDYQGYVRVEEQAP